MIAVTSLLALASFLPVLAPLAPQDPPAQRGPTPERIEAAAKALESAYKDGKPEARVEAIRASVDAVDKKVIDLVARGLKEKDGRVVTAAVDALGRMRHPESTKALVGYYNRDKKTLYKDHESELIDLLKAIGRQGDPAGIEVLTDNVAGAVAYPVIQTRFMALGNIRDARAIEGILSMVTMVGPNTQDRYMDDVRLALMALTGEDRGKDALQWEAWWRDHKKEFKVEPEMKPLPDAERSRWNAFWGLEQKQEPKKEGAGG
jgi:HEAT repeat protein